MGFFEIDKFAVAIVGSRTFIGLTHYQEMCKYIKRICNENNFIISKVISGGARGADFYGKQYAIDNNIEYIEFKPNWNLYGKSAGFKRNEDIIKACDVCIAFWDGESSGTKHDIELCKRLNKKCYIYTFKN